MNLGNDVPQSIIANHVFQRLIRRLTYFLSFWFICCVDCYFPIGTISDDIKHSPIPLKFNLSTPVDAALKFTDGFKIHTAIWNNYFLHAKHLAEVLKFWCTIRIIDRRTWNRMFIWIIPANSVVMWVRMLISTVVICLMPFHFRPPIRPHFCLVNITVIHYRSFDFSGISQIALVLRLIGIWSPFSTISASAAFTDHVCVHCITKRVICATNFIAVQIFMGHCLLVIVHVPPGTAFIIHIEVHQAEKINGEWVQKLTIYYNCVGALFIPDTPSMPVPDVTVNTRRGVYVSYEPAQNGQ
ncbi:MAG: DUF4368 domain-containing protein [Clostridiales bacterium]|nr:DUF4368 domain-containing protein [Clostridiales bacterium]